ncbi:MAG: 3-deoxy-manno-octulosonate-8-phosphatase KdsC [Gammaproteobacteria bacterium]
MADIHELAAGVRLVVFDVDGVFTDGRLYYGADGEEFKTFHVRDGYGIKQLLKHGIQVAVISGRASAMVTWRMHELGVKYIFQGCDDKQPVYQQLLQQLALAPHQVACVGDDLPDVPLMETAGLAIGVHDAHPLVRAQAHWCTQACGGEGAVREVCDLILAARKPAA